MRPLLLICLLSGSVAAPFAVPEPVRAQAAGAEELRFDIPAQPLASALTALANRSHVSIAYDADEIASLYSSPVAGVLTPQIALATLLQGTGLAARFTGPRSAILFDPRSAQATANASAQGIAADRPTMNFDLAIVRAPRMIGRPDPAALNDYLRRAENEVQAMFARDPAYQQSAFDVRIAIAVAADGAIEQVTLLRPSGETGRDALVRQLVLGRNLGPPPPEGVGRPLLFHIAGREMREGRRTTR